MRYKYLAISPRSLFSCTAIMVFILLLVVSACDKSTTQQSGTVSGRVELLNDSGNPDLEPIDFSGIRVSLYELAKVDSLVQNAKSVFNSGGFPLTQNSEFDHREQSEVLFTTTNPDGSFVIPSVPYGVYNLVVSKEGWGYRYLYNITLNSKELNVTQYVDNNGELQLYPELIISGAVDESIEIKNWHHLVISGDATFTSIGSLIIGENGFIRIEPGKKLDVIGQFQAIGSQGNMFRVTSNVISFVKSVNNSTSDSYLSFNIDSSTQVTNSKIAWGNFGPAQVAFAVSNTPNIGFEKCRFTSNNDGLLGSVCGSVSVKESYFSGLTALNNGVHLYMVNDGDIQGNLFVGSRAGILLEEYCPQSIEDNVYVNNEYGIEMFNSDPSIRYNYFRKNNYGIRLTGPISPIVEYNYIDSDTSIIIGYNGYYPNAIPSIHYNNMVAETNFFYLRAANYIDIDAQNNYYYTTSIPEIEQKIYDKYDYPENLQFQVSQILYSPFSMNKVSGAKPRI